MYTAQGTIHFWKSKVTNAGLINAIVMVAIFNVCTLVKLNGLTTLNIVIHDLEAHPLVLNMFIPV